MLVFFFSFIFITFFSTKRHIIVKGLGQIGSSTQPTAEVVRTRLSAVLALVGYASPFEVLSVITYSAKHSPVYNAELDRAEAVEGLLQEFFKFTRRSNPVKRPPELESVSLHHAVTPGTRIRISLLRVSFTNLYIFV